MAGRDGIEVAFICLLICLFGCLVDLPNVCGIILLLVYSKKKFSSAGSKISAGCRSPMPISILAYHAVAHRKRPFEARS